MIQKCSRWRVFELFSKSPSKRFLVREISRTINLASTSVKLHLDELKKEQLIKEEDVGHYHAYSANLENIEFQFYKRMSNLFLLKESGLIEHIESKYKDASCIAIYGKFSSGDDLENDSIKIAVVSKLKKNIDLKKFANIIGRQIILTNFTDITQMKKTAEIIDGIVLKGSIAK